MPGVRRDHVPKLLAEAIAEMVADALRRGLVVERPVLADAPPHLREQGVVVGVEGEVDEQVVPRPGRGRREAGPDETHHVALAELLYEPPPLGSLEWGVRR